MSQTQLNRRETDQVSHGDIYLMLGRLEGKVDALVTTAEQRDTIMKEQNERISVLERARWKIIGMATSASALLGVAFANTPLENFFKS